MVAARWWRPAETIGAVAAILIFYFTWGEMLGLLEELLSNGPLWLFAPLGALLILPVLIETRALTGRINGRSPAAVGGALTLAGWIVAAAAPAYSADRQQRFALQHVTDAASGKAYWSVVNDGAPVPDGYRAVGTWTRGKLPMSTRERWLAAAGRDRVGAPDFHILSSTVAGGERRVTLRLAAKDWERVILIAPNDARVRGAGAPGSVRPIDQPEAGPYAVDCFGRSCDGQVLTLVLGKPGPVRLTVVGSRAGLPASAAPLIAARPRFARPQYGRDETLAFKRRTI